MLSFQTTSEKDRAIAHGYDNQDCTGKPIFTVYFIPDYHSPPAVESADPSKLLLNEQFRLQEVMSRASNLTKIHFGTEAFQYTELP